MSEGPEQPIHRPIEPQPPAPTPERHEPNIPPDFQPRTPQEPQAPGESPNAPQPDFPHSPNESPGGPDRPEPLRF